MNYPNYQNYPQIQQQTQPSQSTWFLQAPSIDYAKNYPVAPGNVVTFKIENQPYVCEKAQGFSQLEGPVFNVYKIIKEDEIPNVPTQNYLLRGDIQPIFDELGDLSDEINTLRDDINYLKDRVASKRTYTKKEERDE